MDNAASEDIIKKIFDAIERDTLLELKEDRVVLVPEKAERYGRLLRAWYSRFMEESVTVGLAVDEVWLALRKDSKSDAEANRKANLTPEGRRLALLRARLTYMPKLIRGLDEQLDGLRHDWYQSKG